MSDLSERFLNAMTELEAVADAVTAEEAAEQFDASTLQLFWRDWTHVSSWAGALWRRLSEDIERPSRAPEDDLEDVGGEGG